MSEHGYDDRLRVRLIECVRKEYITPNFLRVTFSCDELRDFPPDRNGGLIKLFFANRKTGQLELPWRDGDRICWPENKPVSRAYTVRKYRPESNELDIDFVAHGSESPGSGWAMSCQPGDVIGLAGPGGPDVLLPAADWHVLAGDLSALPAISAILEELPEDAKGHALIEIDIAEDEHPLIHPEGVEVLWLVRAPSQDPLPLATALSKIAPPIGVSSISAFVAGENASVIACRNKLVADYQLSKKNLYAIPYWKRGNNEETYHEERHVIMDEEY
ncbi:siderophore-interacting protein [Vibrio cidicii]|uniref:siderophore-interacting protein n=1 Tax=Vibrio cidicii TaxID=1763883 RepID=UPI0018C32993|nr:siderophore-interacting protein [Vibrio cidicii]MBG0757662.1 NADPH-dependent ferric siderophore reductase [Vibrio cidicii]